MTRFFKIITSLLFLSALNSDRTVKTLRSSHLISVLIFFAFLSQLPNWFVLVIDDSEFALMCPRQDLLVQNFCLLVFALKQMFS